MKSNKDIPKAGDRIRIKLNFSRALRPCTVLTITEPDKSGRLSYSVELDGGGTVSGSCHKIATPFYIY